MTKNKIYNQCREEAEKIVYERSASTTSHEHMSIEIHQLTAELYAQKFADWIQNNHIENDCFSSEGVWIKFDDHIGTTAQLHEKFVEENKGGGDE